MSWQEELRELDSLLAAGRVSADEYRVKRDDLLSRASGRAAQSEAPQQQPVQPPAQQPTGEPAPSGPGGGPFPAPFRWEGGSGPGVEHTQHIAAVPGDESSSADRTQIVPGATGGERTQ